MTVTVPDDLESRLTPDQARLALAMGLYVTGNLGFGRAAAVAGLPRPAFQKAMAARRLPMDYTLEDLSDDFAAIESREA